jgi:hypothetical protein
MKQSILILGIICLFTISAISPLSFGYNVKIKEKLLNKNIACNHTVLGESGTASTGYYCPNAHNALKELYEEGQLDFYYITHVVDKNSKSWSYLHYYYNIFGFPTVWWDGGYIVNLGAGDDAKNKYNNSINQCLSRPVHDIDIVLSLDWLDVTKMIINCTVLNNEENTYEGKIKVAICEKESSMGWEDSHNVTYTMPFLDWAFNENISISNHDYWNDVIIWDGTSNGYPSITGINTIIIAAVYNNEWHQGYSGPPPDYPFDAYYIDKCVAADFGASQPPNAPIITGPSNGKIGNTYPYTFTSIDPDGDNISYYVRWGDGNIINWTDFQSSGSPGYTEKHKWDTEGIYIIEAKAKDLLGSESNWSEFIVTMPRNKATYNSFFFRFLDHFPLLQHLLDIWRLNLL